MREGPNVVLTSQVIGENSPILFNNFSFPIVVLKNTPRSGADD